MVHAEQRVSESKQEPLIPWMSIFVDSSTAAGSPAFLVGICTDLLVKEKKVSILFSQTNNPAVVD